MLSSSLVQWQLASAARRFLAGCGQESVAMHQSAEEALRAEAQRARRLARSLTSAEHRDGLLDYARKLEARAEALERRPDNEGRKEPPP